MCLDDVTSWVCSTCWLQQDGRFSETSLEVNVPECPRSCFVRQARSVAASGDLRVLPLWGQHPLAPQKLQWLVSDVLLCLLLLSTVTSEVTSPKRSSFSPTQVGHSQRPERDRKGRPPLARLYLRASLGWVPSHPAFLPPFWVPPLINHRYFIPSSGSVSREPD